MRKRLALLTLTPLLAACGHKAYYDTEPVVKDDDGEWREVDTPGLNEPEVWKTEECFEIKIYDANSVTDHTRKLGVACLDEDYYPEEGEG